MTKNIAARAALDLTRVAAELDAAQADIALLERLRSAADRVKRLSAEQAKLIAERDKAAAEEASRFDDITDVRVTENTSTLGESVLRSGWTVHYTRPQWNMYSGESLPKEHSVDSFGAGPPAVIDFLIEKRPERIPAKIMALAPNDPREAFRRYFIGRRRGYINA